MAIQQAAPATIFIPCRQYDEYGTEIAPIDLTLPEHQPIELILRKPDQTRVIKAQAELTITDAAAGDVQWEAAAGELDQPGKWRAQCWAGEWPSREVAFQVLGPNL